MSLDWKLRPLRGLRKRFCGHLNDESDQHRYASAIVFAPHQDDESLGCGGTIILKRESGTPVKIVFMTDGSTSHRRFLGAEALSQMRREEAIRAAESLGVAVEDLQFFGFPDARLANSHDAAVSRVLATLLNNPPDEVYVPYRLDGTPDHEATYRVVVEAVRKSKLALRVCEYPVWLWNQWPWVPFRIQVKRETVRILYRMIRSGFGLLFFSRFRSGVFVGNVLHRKRSALEQHRSQMIKILEGVDWPTLSGVSDGEFLNCFFQEFEAFHCWNSWPRSATEPERSNRVLVRP